MKKRLILSMTATFSVLAAVVVAGVADSAQRPPSMAERLANGDRCAMPASPNAAAGQRAPQLAAVPGVTNCPGARRVIPPGAPTSRETQVVITRGRDGATWVIPYTAEIVYEQMPDGSVRESEIANLDDIAAAQERIISPEDLAEMRGGPKPPG